MTPDRFGLWAMRYGLPLSVSIAGIVLFLIGGGRDDTAAAGVVLIGMGLVIWMVNWMYRMTIASNDDRDIEERNRDFFTEHGYWPGEGPGRGEGRG